MHNVLIVDDEPMIREGLQLIIPWEEYGFHIFDTASSGTEALEKYNHYQENIDLMIVDIQMPGMDGLRLIEEIRKSNQHLPFIILSGFADFNYAKKAISWGVEDYILKPINEDELICSLGKLKILLENQNQSVPEKSIPARKEQLISSLLTEDNAVDHDNFLNEAKKLDLVWDSYQLLLLEELQQNDVSKKEVELKEFLKNYFDEDNRGVPFLFKSTIYILLNKQLTKNKNLKFLYIELMGILKPYGDFCIIAGSEIKQLSEMKKSFETAQELLKRKFFYTENTPICPAASINPKLSLLPDSNKCLKNENELIDKLVYGLKVGNREVVLKMIEKDFLFFIEDKETENAIKKRYIHLVSSAITKLMNADSTLSWLEGEYPNLVEQIYQSASFSQLEAGIVDFFSMILKEMRIDTKEVQIEKLFSFIHENYHKNIKLEMLAEIFNYSSPYLGKLIKNTTGESFNTYLDKVRIQKAKELLKKNIKVYQVAEHVGYTNVDYFFSKFKKYVGVSPSAYKKETEKELA